MSSLHAWIIQCLSICFIVNRLGAKQIKWVKSDPVLAAFFLGNHYTVGRDLMHKLNCLLTLGRIGIALQTPTPNAVMLCLISLFVSFVHRRVTMTAPTPRGAAVTHQTAARFHSVTRNGGKTEWDIQEINNISELQRGVPDFLECLGGYYIWSTWMMNY